MWNLKRPEVSVPQMVLQLIAVSCVFEEARGRSQVFITKMKG